MKNNKVIGKIAVYLVYVIILILTILIIVPSLITAIIFFTIKFLFSLVYDEDSIMCKTIKKEIDK